MEKASEAKDPAQFFNRFIEWVKQLIANAGSESGCTLALDVARYLLAIDPMHWTVMANNANVCDPPSHIDNVVLLLRQLAVAVKLAERLASEKDNDVDLDANELVEQIVLFEIDVLSDDGSSFCFSDLFENHRQCPRCDEYKNNRAESMGHKHLPVRHLAPPDSLVMLLQKIIEDIRNLRKQLFCSVNKSEGLLKRGSNHHNKQWDQTFGTLRFGMDKKGEFFAKVSVSAFCPKSISCKSKAAKESKSLKNAKFISVVTDPCSPGSDAIEKNNVSNADPSKLHFEQENTSDLPENTSDLVRIVRIKKGVCVCPSQLDLCGEFLGKDLLTILPKDSRHSWKTVPSGPPLNAFAESAFSCKPLFDFVTPLSIESES